MKTKQREPAVKETKATNVELRNKAQFERMLDRTVDGNPVKELIEDSTDVARLYQLVKDIRERKTKVVVVRGIGHSEEVEDPASMINGTKQVTKLY